jgi:hypothetical protein
VTLDLSIGRRGERQQHRSDNNHCQHPSHGSS